MMEFHRREDKASWWEYFRLCGLPEDELQDERRAVGGLEFERVVEQKRTQVQRYSFPAQELDARVGDEVHPEWRGPRDGRVSGLLRSHD